MFQRIQSLYLILVLVAQGLVTTFPFLVFSQNDNTFYLNSNGISNEHGVLTHENYPPLIITIIALVLIIITLISFKNRARQMKLCRAFLLIVLTQVSFIVFNAYALLKEGVAIELLGLSSYLVIASGILISLALKGIKKDDQLVKSVDRIR